MTLLHTALQAFRGKSIVVAAIVAFVYIILSVYAINRTIIFSTMFGNAPIQYKTSLLSSILVGSWNMYTPAEAVLTVIVAVLLGGNIALVIKVIRSLSGKKGIKMSFGGSSLLAVASAGCPSCGVSILSLVGISTPLLPLQGIPLQIASAALLTVSIAYTLHRLRQPSVCEVPAANKKSALPRHKIALAHSR